MMSLRDESRPFSVVGGYLGSGKTTLLNQVLTAAHGRRLALVINDFGAVGVDADLLDRGDGRTLELPGGCVCCQPSGGIAAAMRDVKQMTPAADGVVVEVSGVGDPTGVMPWGDHPGLRRGVCLVCVDTQAVVAQLADRWVAETVRGQLLAADAYLLTKTDLVGRHRVEEVIGLLRSLVEDPLFTSDRVEAAGWIITGTTGTASRSAGGTSGAHAQQHRTATIAATGPIDGERLASTLDELPGVARLKGTLRTSDERRALVQVAGEHRALTDLGPWGAAAGHGRLVLIVDGSQDVAGAAARIAAWLAAGAPEGGTSEPVVEVP